MKFISGMTAILIVAIFVGCGSSDSTNYDALNDWDDTAHDLGADTDGLDAIDSGPDAGGDAALDLDSLDGPMDPDSGDLEEDGESDAPPLSYFTAGHVFVAGSRNAEVFEFNEALELVSRWTHPMFGEVLPAPGQSFQVGPQGMAFDADGRLVVAAHSHFCVFSAPDEEFACYPKVREQPTENIIFDSIGNLYTTTATGGTNEVHKYTAGYEYLTTFSAPTGELTGITCDPESNLYVASQTGGCIYKFARDDLSVLDTIPVAGSLEGLQFFETDSIYVAAHGAVPTIQLVRASSPAELLSSATVAGCAIPVPITTDDEGRIYTADYENGSGTAPADLFILSADGTIIASNLASPVYGPFGMVVAGVVLPCGAYQLE